MRMVDSLHPHKSLHGLSLRHLLSIQLLHIETHILALESHINSGYSVFILVNQECLIPFL